MAMWASLLLLVVSQHLSVVADSSMESHMAAGMQKKKATIGKERRAASQKAHKQQKSKEFPEGTWNWHPFGQYNSPYGKEWLLDTDYVDNAGDPIEKYTFPSTTP